MNYIYKFMNKSTNRNIELDILKIISFESLKNELYKIVDFYDLKHVSYFSVNDTKSKFKEPIFLTTYTEHWQCYYRDNNLYLHDPVLYQTFNNVLPTDWRHFNIIKSKTKSLISIAHDFGVGDFGISIPVRGPSVERAVISFTYDGSKSEWNSFTSDNLKDLIVVAQLIHAAALRTANDKEAKTFKQEFKLTLRERHCLYWASQGKTAYETAVIMGLSTNTVRAYIESARHSLSCVSITQAVSKAIQFNLMPIYFNNK
ncbi:helix-turn-helix transcriptional regulator [Bartonella tamiae]|uniref:HTH luxR-type domain-containing protein n=1 Tax=Bartonella tamiae Th239 TaxID=1094558 RepID=J0QYB4_9HYPH|nr:LuxR family transcriptional regulator [Bartonella tamiae]EJF91096.1 hypothetical protein ME5_00428 [Bartonella tamiae Th239]EJF93239.1 hypothetical protein MEG_01453 [Bartonella tamiae Th307]